MSSDDKTYPCSTAVLLNNKSLIEDFYICSGCCPRHFNPCYCWSSFCSWYVRLLERFFGGLGERIAKHPLVTISVCLAFVSICSVGFFWLQPENRTVKLFIPQSSQAIDDLNTAEKYFRVKNREEIVLLVASPDHPNVLAPECLRQAFKAYHAVVQLESYADYCVYTVRRKSQVSGRLYDDQPTGILAVQWE